MKIKRSSFNTFLFSKFRTFFSTIASAAFRLDSGGGDGAALAAAAAPPPPAAACRFPPPPALFSAGLAHTDGILFAAEKSFN